MTFAPGVTRVLLPVETVEDNTNELDEAFTAVLDEPTGGAVIDSASMADINIRDDDRKICMGRLCWFCAVKNVAFP